MNNPTDVMIDLETLGTKPGCVVLSIGACTFNRFSGDIFETFYVEINRTASAEIGLATSDDTIEWWNNQGEEARMLIARTGTDESLDPREACRLFARWFKNQTAGIHPQGIWANDPDFDCSILSYVFTLTGIKTPWPFWAHRSCRTAVDTGRILGINPKDTLKFEGAPHHALDDAKHQAKYVSVILNAINSQQAQIAKLEEDKRGLIASKANLNERHKSESKEFSDNLIEMLTMLRDAPNEETRTACINSTLEQLSAIDAEIAQ